MALKELNHFRISLPPATAPRPALPLTFFDIIWQKPVERLFFFHFPHSTTDFLETHLPNLKLSLVRTLNIFYPLAGAIRQSLDSVDRLEIRYSDGDSIPFTVCEYEHADFDDFCGHHKRPFEKLKCLVPILKKVVEAQPLLAVQVTLFPNQGLCLGLSIHHAACDGISAVHFIKSWAALSNAASPPPSPPSFDRSFISDPLDLYSKRAQFARKTPPPPKNPTFMQPPTLKTATFTIPSSQIQHLKHKLQTKMSQNENPPFHISAFVISTACAWICLVKAKRYEINRVAHLFFAVNSRNRMHPRPPEHYFGNILGCPCFVKTGVGEISAKKDGFFRACEIIGKAIDEIEDDVYGGMEGVPEKITEVLPHKPLTIAGSPKLRVYDVDFGWGKAKKVEVMSIGEIGAISMAESRDDEGGIEIGVVLLEDEIDEFGKQFQMFQEE